MSWSIAQVARMSRTTSRTLRHYDAIGLLPPAYVGVNGYRYYDQAQLLRLQQILLLRELGLGLDAITGILDDQHDQAAALRRHRRWLLAERDRLSRLADTVARTIEELEGGEDMPAEKLFDGFEVNPYEDEAVARWGQDTVDSSKERVRGWTPEQAEQAQRGWVEALARVAEHQRAGADPDDPAVLDAVAAHHAWLGNFWTPDQESYAGLGRLYVDDPRFQEQIDREHPGLAQYLCEAMAAYGQRRLG